MLTVTTHAMATSLAPGTIPHENGDKLAGPTPFDTKQENDGISSQNSCQLSPNQSLVSTQSVQDCVQVNDPDSLDKAAVGSQPSISSQSTQSFSDINNEERRDSDENAIGCSVNSETSQGYIDELVREANGLIDSKSKKSGQDNAVVSVLKQLTSCLVKTKNKANQYKIKSELLSISSKDADMRYEVENDLIKREVESLKHQSENRDYLVKKITHQRQTLEKYKNVIRSKNKELIELKSLLNKLTRASDKKRKLVRAHTTLDGEKQGNMLDTLGMLASQVLTEEQQQNRK